MYSSRVKNNGGCIYIYYYFLTSYLLLLLLLCCCCYYYIFNKIIPQRCLALSQAGSAKTATLRHLRDFKSATEGVFATPHPSNFGILIQTSRTVLFCWHAMQVAVMALQQTLGLMTKPHPIVFGCFKQYSLTPVFELHALHLTCSVWQHTLSSTSSHPIASGLPLQNS